MNGPDRTVWWVGLLACLSVLHRLAHAADQRPAEAAPAPLKEPIYGCH